MPRSSLLGRGAEQGVLALGQDLLEGLELALRGGGAPQVEGHHTGRIGSLVGLLRGELSDDVLAVLTDARDGLFPEPRELALDCSCPDGARVCKHVAAVLYGVSVRLDTRPELFFDLRQVDQAELIGSATAGAVGRPRPAAGKRIAADRLSAVFGIELEAAPPAARSRRGRPPSVRRRSRRSSARRRERPEG